MNALHAFIVLTVVAVGVDSQTAGSPGVTTRYWDCCKASCSWPGKAPVSAPVNNCAKDGTTVVDPNGQNVCGGGGTSTTTYMCSNNQPYVINNTLAMGFVAATISGTNKAGNAMTETDWCCACYEIIFTSSTVVGKRMVVQVTNTGSDLGSNHMDIQIPGGGVGIYNGCQNQWGAPSDGWGARYGGVSSSSQCSQLPTALQSGCNFRFVWFASADNPNMTLTRTACPASIIAKTGCKRTDDSDLTVCKDQRYVKL